MGSGWGYVWFVDATFTCGLSDKRSLGRFWILFDVVGDYRSSPVIHFCHVYWKSEVGNGIEFGHFGIGWRPTQGRYWSRWWSREDFTTLGCPCLKSDGVSSCPFKPNYSVWNMMGRIWPSILISKCPFSHLERMGKESAMPESHKAPKLLASINPSSALEVTAAEWRTKDVIDLTWEYISTTLIDEYNDRHVSAGSKRANRPSRNNRKRKRNVRGFDNSAMSSSFDDRSES